MDSYSNPTLIVLYVCRNGTITKAPEEDILVAKGYYNTKNKGAVLNDRRVTVLSKKNNYEVKEEIRIIHVMELLAPGYPIYIMGPKSIYNEYVNDQIQNSATYSEEDDPFKPLNYDGRVLQSPGIDFNFEITVYSFDKPGTYRIHWQPGKLKSNTLMIHVE